MMRGIEYHFEDFCLMPDQARLLKGEREIKMAPKIFQFLSMLVQAENTLVEREALFETLWQGRAVSDESLAQVVAQCRRALGDSASRQALVQTIPKRGFRFVPDIRAMHSSVRKKMPSLMVALQEGDPEESLYVRSR